MSRLLYLVVAAALAATTGCASSQKPEKHGAAAKPHKSEAPVEIEELEVGQGPAPKAGQMAMVHVVGHTADGKEFVNTRKKGKPRELKVGDPGKDLPGLDDALTHFAVGGRYKVIVPPDRRVYEVELVGVRDASPEGEEKRGGGRHGGGGAGGDGFGGGRHIGRGGMGSGSGYPGM